MGQEQRRSEDGRWSAKTTSSDPALTAGELKVEESPRILYTSKVSLLDHSDIVRVVQKPNLFIVGII